MQERSPANEGQRFAFERFSPPIQKAIEQFSEKLIARQNLGPRTFAFFFRTYSEYFSAAQIEYFNLFVRLTVRQLVIGAFYGPNKDISNEEEERQVALILGGQSSLVFQNDLLFHDVAHTIIALGRHPDKTSLTSLVPDFQKKTQSSEDYSSEEERRRAIDSMNSDENLAAFWTYFDFYEPRHVIALVATMKERYTKSNGDVDLERAQNQFITEILRGREPDEFARNFLIRIFNEVETNPMIMFDIFKEITLPLMHTHAPEVARKVS